MQINSGLKTSRLRAAGHDERRRSVRHTISAVVQIVDLGSGLRMTTRASDLSEGGCYVDALTPLPVGTQVRLGLHKDNRVIELNGKIVYSSPGLGMGIAFTESDADQQAALDDWIASLEHEKQHGASVHVPASPEPIAPPAARNAGHAAGATDGRAIVTRLVHLLVAKGVLSEDDAEMILQRH